jgi:hypothetical protein
VLATTCCRCVGNAGPGDEVVFFPVTDDVLAFIVAEYPETLSPTPFTLTGSRVLDGGTVVLTYAKQR